MKDPEERTLIPLDPEEALRALLAVDPAAPAADEDEENPPATENVIPTP